MALQDPKAKNIIHLSSLHIRTRHLLIWSSTCIPNPNAELNPPGTAGNPGKLSTHPEGWRIHQLPGTCSWGSRQHRTGVCRCRTVPAQALLCPRLVDQGDEGPWAFSWWKISHTDHVTYSSFDELIRFCSFCPSRQVSSSVS